MSQIIYNVGIIGAGLIGYKRAAALSKFENCRLIATADINKDAAKNISHQFGGEAESDWQNIIKRNDIDVIIAATFNKFLAPICIASLKNGKHILCEKPLGRNIKESEKIIEVSLNSETILKTGFNHRHHPAIYKAKKLSEEGEIGKIHFIRCIYGHGGRPGYEKEWRASKEICGGGELLDQGVHIIDLFRWFLGEFDEVYSQTHTFYWKMEVEDNAFAIFKTKKEQIAVMHSSWTQWKNKFLFEIYGEKGCLIVEGLGGSYGTEKLIKMKRKFKTNGIKDVGEIRTTYIAGPPEEEINEFPGSDISWIEEWKEFISAIKENRKPLGSGYDGLMANKLIDAVYQSAKLNKPIKIN